MSGTAWLAQETLSCIRNCVCPDCGGAIIPQKDEFRCRGLCGKDWRPVWDKSELARPKDRAALRIRLRANAAHANHLRGQVERENGMCVAMEEYTRSGPSRPAPRNEPSDNR